MKTVILRMDEREAKSNQAALEDLEKALEDRRLGEVAGSMSALESTTLFIDLVSETAIGQLEELMEQMGLARIAELDASEDEEEDEEDEEGWTVFGEDAEEPEEGSEG